MRRTILLMFVVGIVSTLGCDTDAPEDAAIALDVGPAEDAGNEPTPEAPTPPAAVAWECPEGWSEVAVGTAQACEPWPNGWAGCPDGERRFVGDAACAPFGVDCPTGDWPSGLPATGVRYVREGAAGGDGSEALPFGTITEGYDAATEGDVIAIARGTYDEALIVDRGVTLWGACASETFIRPDTAPDTPSTILTLVPDTVVRGVTVGGDRWGLRAHGAGVLEVRDVIVSGATTFGLVASGGATLRANDVVVRGGLSSGDGGAAVANAASTLALTRVIFEDNEHGGIFAFDEGTQVELTDFVVRRTLPRPDTLRLGVGLAIGQHANLVARRLVVEHSHAQGVGIQNRGTIDASDVVIRGTQPEEASGTSGGGLVLIDWATGTVERAFIEDNVGGGASANQAATVTFRDLVVRTVLAPEVAPFQATGIVSAGASTLEVERAYVHDCAATALVSIDWSTLTGRDVTVRALQAGPDLFGSRGINVVESATLELDRVEIVEAVEAGIYVAGAETTATFRDVRITDTQSRPSDGRTGRGLVVVAGADVELSRAVLTRQREVAILARSAALRMNDVVIEDTLPMACEGDTCTGAGGGTGLAIVDDATLDASSFIIQRSYLAGLQVARVEAPITLGGGLVANNPIGANLQDVGFDLGVIGEGVIFRDNGVNLDASSLYLPEPDL